MRNETVKGHLDLLLLQVLVGAPAHGYQIACTLREHSEGAFDLAEGTLYPALHRLEDQRLVASDWDVSGPRRRRVYRLTVEGRAALRSRRGEWARFTHAVDAVLGTSG